MTKKSPKEEEKEYDDDNCHTDEQIGNDFEEDLDYDPDTAGNMYTVPKAIASKSQFASLITQRSAMRWQS